MVFVPRAAFIQAWPVRETPYKLRDPLRAIPPNPVYIFGPPPEVASAPFLKPLVSMAMLKCVFSAQLRAVPRPFFAWPPATETS